MINFFQNLLNPSSYLEVFNITVGIFHLIIRSLANILEQFLGTFFASLGIPTVSFVFVVMFVIAVFNFSFAVKFFLMTLAASILIASSSGEGSIREQFNAWISDQDYIFDSNFDSNHDLIEEDFLDEDERILL